MEISQEELKSMLAEAAKQAIEGLQQSSAPEGSRILRRITERKVEIRMIDNRVVIGYANKGSDNRPLYLYEIPNPKDPNGPRLMMVDLILEGAQKGEKPMTLEFKQFRTESTRVSARIIKTEEKEWVLNQGTVKRREIEEYSSVELDFEVPLDVVGKTRLFTVEVPKEYGGPRQVTVHENYVNIG